LGFDLRFHADYTVAVPVRALAGAGSLLQVAMRVTPTNKNGNPADLTQRFVLPDIPPHAKGVFADGLISD
jgi:hypothetical protein